ncbi:MAG TPA: asparagine synthase-related protein [Candidatus Saccharimonadales bacterium]|jgi:asparagine synthase (glutamine-hydrolysing)|nr:asparagine synthase-related protein [Candidatus Saccharimonadales bacterium]
MSGIVGILNLDGAPVDRSLLQNLTSFLKPRGPDAQQIWMDGPVGFGHSLFKTTDESEHESQPFTLGTGTWITADARIDAQSELIEKLKIQGQHITPHPTDVELILRAYEAWGESCVEHLLGDFAFGIWDSRRQRLLCARDHMGVRPFYYSQIGSFVVFSNSLDCIRECPVVSNRLNDLAIADFLLFGHNQDSATTSFADIRRLPPAHCASWSGEGHQTRRFWTMPIDEPLFFKRKDDYCDRFKELLREAVGDRLRTPRVGVFMSGGLDSPTLAATARDLLQERFSNFELLALTAIDDIKPDEGYYAGLVAKYLEIPIHYYKWDDRPVDPNWEQTPFRTPEPCAIGWDVIPNRIYRRQAGLRSRVFFWGEGPDNALILEWRPFLLHLIQRHMYGHIPGAIGSTLIAQRKLPFWGTISNRAGQLWQGSCPVDTFPTWLNPDLELRLKLNARWRDNQRSEAKSSHPIRPEGYASLHIPLWQLLFEGMDSGTKETFFEMRHPFVDLRILRFLLAVPPLPWCRSKYLLRRSMRGALPNQVLQRKKKGLPGDRLARRLVSLGSVPFTPTANFLGYVDPKKILDVPIDNQWAFEGHMRARSLNHWLQYSQGLLHNS